MNLLITDLSEYIYNDFMTTNQTVEEFAAQVNLPVQEICDILAGKMPVRDEVLAKLADGTKTTFEMWKGLHDECMKDKKQHDLLSVFNALREHIRCKPHNLLTPENIRALIDAALTISPDNPRLQELKKQYE